MRKPALRQGPTVWLNTTKPAARYPVLRGHQQTDVAIVGGGLTGAMIAQAFAEHGTSVIVVDAARVGEGSTAASTALLLQEPDHDLEALSRRYDSRTARLIWRRSREAARDFVHAIRRLKIACDLREVPSLYYTLSQERAKVLQRELKKRRAARLGGEWLDEDALLRASGIHGAGAIKTAGNAQLNPLRACIGFLSVARKDGASIYERTTINRIRRPPMACGCIRATARSMRNRW